jgi:large subunit ribosomal protein L32e
LPEKSEERDELMKLHLFKEEYIAKLEALGITSAEELAEALEDEERTKEIHEHLKGVGEKTIQHWREDLGVVIEDEEIEAEPAPEPKEKAPAKKVRKIKEPEEAYKVKLKPKLSKETLEALRIRASIDDRRPEFLRQEWHARKRLQRAKWRKPQGDHSKMRQHYGYRRNVVSIGYGSPKAARHLHPSGFREVMVHNVNDLSKINPEVEAARVGRSVGYKKRQEIEAKADELKIRVLNRSG